MYTLSFQPHTLIEPFRIKTVTPIHMTSQEQRNTVLAAAHYNLFLLRAEDAHQIRGVQITWQAPQLRHFTARFVLL